MRKLAIVPLIAYLLLSFEANAQDKDFNFLESGNTLLSTCKKYVRIVEGERPSTMDLLSGHVCLTYIKGFTDGAGMATVDAAVTVYGMDKALNWTNEEVNRRIGPFCIPDKVEKGQTIKVVVRYLETHPEKLHFLPSALVYDALSTAFPCKRE